jgi:hypothetical protein
MQFRAVKAQLDASIAGYVRVYTDFLVHSFFLKLCGRGNYPASVALLSPLPHGQYSLGKRMTLSVKLNLISVRGKSVNGIGLV